MNVDDFDFTEHLSEIDCKMQEIFKKQESLMLTYHKIEEHNGLLQTTDHPVDINDRHGQARLKDFSWRVTEELGEATDALLIHPDNLTHYREELIDALHFYVELMIICGSGYSRIRKHYRGARHDLLDELFLDMCPDIGMDSSNSIITYDLACRENYKVIQFLSNAMNCLKNKPWKNTHLITDKNRFEVNLLNGFKSLFGVLFFAGLSPDEIYITYCLKNQVNQFRQRSNY